MGRADPFCIEDHLNRPLVARAQVHGFVDRVLRAAGRALRDFEGGIEPGHDLP
jgi:hypothetical protein